MTVRSLEDLLRGSKSVSALLYNQQTGANVFPGVAPEYTNWRDEQRAWQETCVLFNQSYHMVELVVEGRDAFKLLSRLAYNSFDGFTVGKAKQFAPCSYDGYVIGDVILFYVAENKFEMVGRAPAINWVRYHAETGGYDVRLELDERTAARKDPSRRRSYRFQVQGPNAMKVIEKATGRPAPDVKFFNMVKLTIAGKTMWALRHGMVGQPGLRAFRSVGRWRSRASGARRGRPGVRNAACRWTRLFFEYAGVRLDSVAPACGLYRRGDETVSRVVARRRI